ncbi:MAG TPA: hypothetical protein VNV41_07230 [Candidatus Acidoferrales bacterium]|nr:hypothetical protein [Candidatus Acidoferrales bacterium]
MSQPLSTSTGHIGQVIFVAPNAQFGKLMHDTTAIITWVFRPDMPANLKKGDRVTFDVAEYNTKGQVRRKAKNLQTAPELTIAEPKPADDPNRVLVARKAKPVLPAPSREATAKLVSVAPTSRKFVRL